jgi:energy-coupling factor transport system permease protein
MLPLARLAAFMLLLGIFLLWAQLLPGTARQVWRIAWILALLFLMDWWLVGLAHAALVVARLVLLAAIFSLFFATTTTRELSLALERLGVPYRFAFSLNVAFQSLGLLDDEWHTIREAQRARGVWSPPDSLKQLLKGLGDFVSLTVPVIVLATRRAWEITEAASARGFNSPQRKPYQRLAFSRLDWFLLAGMLAMLLPLFLWR